MVKSKRNSTGKKVGENLQIVADQMGNMENINLQTGTNVTMARLDDLLWKALKLRNVGWEQGKGNLFEYIEAVRLERNMANAGHGTFDKPIVTDLPKSRGGSGEPLGPVDFIGIKGGRTSIGAQAKVNKNPHDTAGNFINPKYEGMQLVTTIDNYNDVIHQLDKMLEKGEINKAVHDETIMRMRPCLTDDRTGITSGGTTSRELKQFRAANGKVDAGAVRNFVKQVEKEQIRKEILGSTKQGAAAGAIMGFVVSSAKEAYGVYKGDKDWKEAGKNVVKGTTKSGVRGAAVGTLSAVVRTGAAKHTISILADGNAATAMASGIVDCGASIYAYAKGEISADALMQDVKRTLISSSSAWYFSTAIKVAVGTAGGVFLPMAIYAASSSMLMATKAIIDEAKLKAEEYRRAAALLEEETAVLREYRKKLDREFSRYRNDRKAAMERFLYEFDHNAFETSNYVGTINSLFRLANDFNISLQYEDPREFAAAMNNPDVVFVLK